MFYHCDRCGFSGGDPWRPAPECPECPVCGLGTMVEGQGPDLFGVDRDGGLVPRNARRPDYQPVLQGSMGVPETFNYFCGLLGGPYREFVERRTTYVGRFTNIMVPDAERFAWLAPYTGGRHNRTHFTQLVLATVARAKFRANGGRFPRLVEPFVGSGQIFLHACAWGPALNDGVPLFHQVIAGDLNPYLVAAYRFVLDRGTSAAGDYLLSAASRDAADGEFGRVVRLLNTHGRALLANTGNPGGLHEAGVMYMWLVNRCLRGSSLNTAGGVSATLNDDIERVSVRQREERAIRAVVAVLRGVDFELGCRDFAQTTALARPGDIVFMDCPFPKFANRVPGPDELPARPEVYDSVSVNTYGTGDDGERLQTRIVDEAHRLTRQGTTVILRNFANPGLVLAYRRLLTGIGPAERRHYVYTYRSPSTMSEAYQLVVLPGVGVDLGDLPQAIRGRWVHAGGDDGYDVDDQEFFPRRAVATDLDEERNADDYSEDPDYVET